MDEIEFIAAVRHLGWCCYQLAASQPYNLVPTEDQKASLLQGVRFGLSKPECTPEENHNNWMAMKKSQGWVYGPVKDLEKKTHPDLVPFDQLPQVEADKDVMDNFMQRAAKALWQEVNL